MSRERLEELKSREREVDFLLGGTRFREDWDWLIEQAERVSKQETRINNLTFELAVSRVKNKRYREALELIKRTNPVLVDKQWFIDVANQASE